MHTEYYVLYNKPLLLIEEGFILIRKCVFALSYARSSISRNDSVLG